jgi:CheY-like chemotaxis protein
MNETKYSQTGGAVVIRTRYFESWDWLRAACRRRGLAAVWQRGTDVLRIDGASAALFDAAELDDRELDELRHFAAAARPAPTVALVSFPRVEDRDRAVSAGAAAVASKPFVEAELFAELAVCPS